jgi:hypothetical protein
MTGIASEARQAQGVIHVSRFFMRLPRQVTLQGLNENSFIAAWQT